MIELGQCYLVKHNQTQDPMLVLNHRYFENIIYSWTVLNLTTLQVLFMFNEEFRIQNLHEKNTTSTFYRAIERLF
jgi:hypothetical protein